VTAALARASFALLLLAPGVAPAFDTLVVANKDAATVWLLDPVTGERRAEVQVGVGPHEAATSPDGRTAVICNYGAQTPGNSLTVVDVESGETVRTVDLGEHRRPHGIRYLDDRHVLVTSESSLSLVKVDVQSGEIVGTFDAGGDIHLVDLTEDGRTAVATAVGAGKVCAVSLAEENEDTSSPRCVETGRGTEAIAVRPGGGEVWVGHNGEHVVKVVGAADWSVTAEIDCGLQPIRIAFTPEGRHALVSCVLTGDLVVIDAERRELVKRVKLADGTLDESAWKGKSDEEVEAVVTASLESGRAAIPIGVLPAPDGFVYVATHGLDLITVVDPETWKVVRTLPTGAGPDGMAFSRIAN
jgi:YVTN family beta-propeller protein